VIPGNLSATTLSSNLPNCAHARGSWQASIEFVQVVEERGLSGSTSGTGWDNTNLPSQELRKKRQQAQRKPRRVARRKEVHCVVVQPVALFQPRSKRALEKQAEDTDRATDREHPPRSPI
jgi:hypothetical protein